MSRLADHYAAVQERRDLEQPDRARWRGIDPAVVRRFVAVDDPIVVDGANRRPTLVCMGVSTTGPPHLGTVGQFRTAIALQRAGLDVQFVLADLEPYHGGGNAERIDRLAGRYRSFALDLGFDPDAGTLRTQSEATDVMATGHRLARYYDPDAWSEDRDGSETAWERAVEAMYEAATSGTAEQRAATDARTDDAAAGEADADPDRAPARTSEAADAHSAVLHGADFLHPLLEGEYDQVLLTFGVDEHGLVPWTRRFREAAGVPGRVGGLLTRMVPGFGDVPKQSKSIGAGVPLDGDPDEIRERIATAPDAADPAASTVFQAMALASAYDAERLDALESACRAGGSAWTTARREYGTDVADLAERWQRTAE